MKLQALPFCLVMSLTATVHAQRTQRGHHPQARRHGCPLPPRHAESHAGNAGSEGRCGAGGREIGRRNRCSAENKVFERTLPFLSSKDTEARGFGWQTEQRWQETVATAAKLGLVDTSPAARDLFTTEFLR